jgi:predicted MFS family arabinose efflux permease
MSAPAAVGYFELLRRRPAFLKLWLAEVSSLAGDWFTLIALYALLLEYTGKGESVGLMLATRFVPSVLFGPFAGVAADRLPRKWILIAADLGRAATVLGFMLVKSASDVWLIYALVFVQMTLSAFFEPTEASAIASVVERDELVAANTLVGATWSAMLSVGAVSGGIVVAFVGRNAAFCIDAASFVISALLISGSTLAKEAAAKDTGEPLLARTLSDLGTALKLFVRDPAIRRILLVKSGWAISGGGAILLYAVLGDHEFAVAGSGTAGIGVLLSTRGIGALTGPLVARRIGGDDPRWLERAITVAFAITAIFYVAFAYSPTLPVAALMLCLAHTGVSTQWVFSSSLIGMTAAPEVRGRVFALDTMLFTLMMAISSWGTGAAMDRLGVAPRTLMAILGGLLVLPLGLWLAQRSMPLRPGPDQSPSHDSGGGAAA